MDILCISLLLIIVMETLKDDIDKTMRLNKLFLYVYLKSLNGFLYDIMIRIFLFSLEI